MARSKVLGLLSFVLLIMVTSFVGEASAQDLAGQRWEFYALASSWAGDAGGGPAAGFRIGGAWWESPDLSLVVDASRHFVSDQETGITTLLAGPRFYNRGFFNRTFHRRSSHHNGDARVTGFAQLMMGSQRSSEHGRLLGWNFVLAPGAGVDIRLTDHLTFRPLELELTLTQGPGTVRASSGFSFRFGH
jgi:hypothetical protein